MRWRSSAQHVAQSNTQRAIEERLLGGNLLMVEIGGSSSAFRCRTCPYIYLIREKLTSKQLIVRKEVDDVLGGAEVGGI